jgi:hypothetical protein
MRLITGLLDANDGALVFIKSTGLYHYDKFGIAHVTGITIDISEQRD